MLSGLRLLLPIGVSCARPTSIAVAPSPTPVASVHAVVGFEATPSCRGYWMASNNGGVFPFGDGGGHGSPLGLHLNQPIVGMESTPDGQGYWLVRSDGGIFPFGDAQGFGSTGGVHLNPPILALAGPPGGLGFLLGARPRGDLPVAAP